MGALTLKGGGVLQARLEEIAAKVKSGGFVRAGFLETATYPDGTPVAMVAATQNYGAPSRGIPPRPFFTTMVDDGEVHWGDDLAAFLKASDYDVGRALGLMGEEMKGEIEAAIIATDSPPLSAITLMLRKMRSDDQSLVVTGKTIGEAARRVAAGEDYSGVSTKPLVDTSTMLNRADYEVHQ